MTLVTDMQRHLPVAEHCPSCDGWHLYGDTTWIGDPYTWATKERAELAAPSYVRPLNREVTRMNLDGIRSEIEARIEHLSALHQPGPVDLGPDDNEMDQDTLFAELRALGSMLAVGRGGAVMTKEHRQQLARLEAYADALNRADDRGYLDKAAPFYTALALVEVGKALVEIADALKWEPVGQGEA